LVGQSDKAVSLIADLVAIKRKSTQADDTQFAGVLAQVSRTLLENRQFAAAEPYVRECLAIREKALQDDWTVFNTKSMLGGALAGQQKYGEAEPLLVSGFDGMSQREDKIPALARDRIIEAVQRLVDLYTAWNKPDEAAKWKAELDKRKTPVQGKSAEPAKEPAKETATQTPAATADEPAKNSASDSPADAKKEPSKDG
jgi:hypothetical protein